jgi:hypothetical protein
MTYDDIIKKTVGEDFEEVRYHDDCYITVRECKQIMKALEDQLKEDMVECDGCGEEIPETDLYCRNCGDENF